MLARKNSNERNQHRMVLLAYGLRMQQKARRPSLTRLCWRMKHIGEIGVFETTSPDDTRSI